jgi:hypothetical protein
MRELRLLSTEPVERGTHFRRSGQAGDFLLNRGSDVRYVRALRRGAHGELFVILQRGQRYGDCFWGDRVIVHWKRLGESVPLRLEFENAH